MEFVRDNWVALLSLVIALTGGVPGILALISYLTEKPKLTAQASSIVTGVQRAEGGCDTPFVLIALTVANAGRKSLSPRVFDLRVRVDGIWQLLERSLIPEGFTPASEVQVIEVDRPWLHDLQRSAKPLRENEYQHGFLMFAAPSLSLTCLRNCLGIEMELMCTDVIGEEYRHRLTVQLNPTNAGQLTYPHHGMSVTNKASSRPSA